MFKKDSIWNTDLLFLLLGILFNSIIGIWLFVNYNTSPQLFGLLLLTLGNLFVIIRYIVSRIEKPNK